MWVASTHCSAPGRLDWAIVACECGLQAMWATAWHINARPCTETACAWQEWGMGRDACVYYYHARH